MPSARDRVLDAYETLLIEAGPASATLDAVAAAAQVSKGGLLYHFASKDALVAGLLARLLERSAADADAIRAAPEGGTAYYLRTSAPDGTRDPGAVRDAMAAVDADALGALRDDLGDPVLAWLVQLVGDGLYLRTLIGTPLPEGLSVADLLDRLRPQLPPQG
jgi:AcrR family transcriptional regulator